MAKSESPAIEKMIDLAAEKARSDALIASVGEAMIATDEYGKITRINQPALDFLEMTDEEVMGKNFLNIFHAYDMNGNDIEPMRRPIMRSLVDGRPVNVNMQYAKKDGSRSPVMVTVSPIILKDKPIGAIEIFRDITREQQIDRAKTEFVSLASHQLRTPLTAIRWYVELLLKETMGPLTPEQRESLEEIHISNLRMIELVSALLSVARIEVGTLTAAPEPLLITQLAHEVVTELKPQILEKEMLFSEKYDPAIPSTPLDPDLTRIVFQNLLTNAIKYTPKGGSVSLQIDCDGKYIMIKISDTGYGVPKNQQKQLFTKLFRADNVREKDTDGTGLGLYIVQSIVKNAKGKIWFDSIEGEGSTFYVWLPVKGMPGVKRK
jgi:PAS domain S-box-containing protein